MTKYIIVGFILFIVSLIPHIMGVYCPVCGLGKKIRSLHKGEKQ